MQKKILLTHPGTQYSAKLAEQLFRMNILFKFVTDFKISTNNALIKFINKFFITVNKTFISNRLISIPGRFLNIYPSVDILHRIISLKIKSPNDLFYFSNKYFQNRIAKRILKKSDIVIGFDTASWILSQRARELNKKFILDVSIAHSKEKELVINYLNKKFPEWAVSNESKKKKYIAYEELEHQTADMLVVASTFTKKTLLKNNVSDEKIFLNPYGVDITTFRFNDKRDFTKKLKFVFIGSVSARKGVPALLQAWEKIDTKNAELLIIGPIGDKERKLIPTKNNIKVMGKIPNESLPEIIDACHIFVFPSYFEGFGLVILEAMAAGLVVITTDATAGPDIIENGKEGFIYHAFDEDKLFEYMQYCMYNRGELKNISYAARKKAEMYTWDAYGERYYNLITTISQSIAK